LNFVEEKIKKNSVSKLNNITGNLLRYNFPFTELQIYVFKEINTILIHSKQLYSTEWFPCLSSFLEGTIGWSGSESFILDAKISNFRTEV